jgi:hypothetical protein
MMMTSWCPFCVLKLTGANLCFSLVGHDRRLLLFLLFQQVLGLVLPMGGTASTTDVELLVLWHDLASEHRQGLGGRP